MENSGASGKISRSNTISLHGNVDAVFPLFGPIREKEWADGWEPVVIHPSTDLVAEHMVFTTKAHFDDEPDYTWTVSKYQPEDGAIEYTVFAPERLWWISIRCRPSEGGEVSQAEITYTYLGLTSKGRVRNQESLESMYRYQLKDWEEAINHYLATGQRLRHTR